VYVTSLYSDTVTIIEGTAVVNTLAVGRSPCDVAVNPATHLAYVANYDSDSVTVIGTSSQNVRLYLPLVLRNCGP
jgi:YVTN family beta-propeller protein